MSMTLIWKIYFQKKNMIIADESLFLKDDDKMKTYVYFMEDGYGHVKIGVSNDPEKRLKQCQTGNPYKLIITRVEPYESSKEAYKRENELHNTFKDFNTHGEWFKRTLVETFLRYDSPTYEDYMYTAQSLHVKRALL